MKLAVCGASGRMGIAVINAAVGKGHDIAAAFDASDSPFTGQDISAFAGGRSAGVIVSEISAAALREADAVIDFSSTRAAETLLMAAMEAEKPVVIGTTGFSEEERGMIRSYSEKIPVLFSYNMSVGVNIMFKLTELASRALNDYDVEIFEAHHRHKKDAPSGTAVRLLEIIKENNERLKDAREEHGRKGITGERTGGEIGVHAMRGGGIVGEHTVFFAGPGDRIEITHRAADRSIFAAGAVLAAEFIADKSPGLYTMYDLLGLSHV